MSDKSPLTNQQVNVQRNKSANIHYLRSTYNPNLDFYLRYKNVIYISISFGKIPNSQSYLSIGKTIDVVMYGKLEVYLDQKVHCYSR